MTITTPRKINRKHRHGLSKISLHLSWPDLDGLQRVRQAYAAGLGLDLSSSLIMSLAISSLLAETATGHLRRSPELYVAKEAA